MKEGLFITFEGGEGSGKTTIINKLVPLLEAKGLNVLTSREPGGVRIAEDIRNIILDPKNTEMCYETEALLFAASRMQHLKEKVIPALLSGKVVICDRYLDSSLVYQGYCRGLGFDKVLRANAFASEYMPKVTFFIDVTPEVGLSRLKGRSGKIDRLDKECIDFHQKVYDGYIKLCEMYPDRVKRIDGNRDVLDIVNEILDIIEKLVK
jgi:dTMP kinase